MKKVLSIVSVVSFLWVANSCTECKNCERQRTVEYINIPSLSTISPPTFNSMKQFQTVLDTFQLGEVCGDNIGDTPKPDTIPVENPIDKTLGGIFRVIVNVDKCN
jgi:hypothetical protein